MQTVLTTGAEGNRFQLSCECGVTIASDDLDELVRQAREHALREHGIELSTELLAGLVERS